MNFMLAGKSKGIDFPFSLSSLVDSSISDALMDEEPLRLVRCSMIP